jgi:DNA-binding CsgD family transcriptional regulator
VNKLMGNQNQNDFINKVFWKAPNPMGITTAKEGIYIDVNEAFTKYFRLERHKAIGKSAIELGHISKERRLRVSKDIKQKGYAKNILIKHINKNNKLQCIIINTTPVKINTQVLWLTVGTDISGSFMATKDKKDDVIKIFDSVNDEGIILVSGCDEDNPFLFYANEEAEKIFKNNSLKNLIHKLDEQGSAYLTVGSKSYFVRKLGTLDNSHIQLILMQKFTSNINIKQIMENFNFTRRQQEVALLAATGHTNTEIADKLFISGFTVKDHLKEIFKIIGIHKRSEIFPTLFDMR